MDIKKMEFQKLGNPKLEFALISNFALTKIEKIKF